MKYILRGWLHTCFWMDGTQYAKDRRYCNTIVHMSVVNFRMRYMCFALKLWNLYIISKEPNMPLKQTLMGTYAAYFNIPKFKCQCKWDDWNFVINLFIHHPVSEIVIYHNLKLVNEDGLGRLRCQCTRLQSPGC